MKHQQRMKHHQQQDQLALAAIGIAAAVVSAWTISQRVKQRKPQRLPDGATDEDLIGEAHA